MVSLVTTSLSEGLVLLAIAIFINGFFITLEVYGLTEAISN